MDIVNFLSEQYKINFSEQQKEGVLTNYKNTLLLAVPGSGKTTVLVSRIANLILNYRVAPSCMLTLTYSKESAGDMAKRFSFLFGKLIDSQPHFLTIHSLCYQVMLMHSRKSGCNMPTLISQNKGLKQRALREIYKKYNNEYLTDDLYEKLVEDMGFAKNMMLKKQTLVTLDDEIQNFSKIVAEFERFKSERNLYEYDDMLVNAYRIFVAYPEILRHYTSKYTHINVDEAQDTSILQHEIIKLIVGNNSLFMVGDEDQCIYSFRGAYPQAMLEFSKTYQDATVIKMEQNFRSNSDIVMTANDFIKRNKQRYSKDMFCNNKKIDSIITIELQDYCKQVDYIVQYICKHKTNQSIAVLYRNNDSAIPLIDQFYRKEISYYSKDAKQNFFTSNTVNDIIAYIKLSFDQCDVDAFSQIYYKMGLTKGVFNYVKLNITNYVSVFDAVISLETVKDYLKEQLNYYRFGFAKLAKMKPTVAIEYILSTLGYEYFIEKKLSDNSARILSYQKLSTLIAISEGLNTLDELLNKLFAMNKMLDERKNVNINANVTLSTLHSSKGLEFDTVILIDTIKDVIPTANAVNKAIFGKNEDLEGESRLFYVGITRAREKLILFKSGKLNGRNVLSSSFVEEFFKNQLI